ncbi:MAG: zf-HC2 domain-containing protein [candidate division Zixibacteria bacterium]
MPLFHYKCQLIKRLLSDRTDDPLRPKIENKVQKHLEICEDCRKEADFYVELSNVSPKLGNFQPPNYLWERISLAVDEHPWEEGDNSHPIFQFSFLHSYKNSIPLAGVVATVLLVIILTLMPDLSTDMGGNNNQVQAGEINPEVAYVSLFMMSQGDKYPPEVQDYFISQLNGLNEKIAIIKTAMERHPHNQEIKLRLAEVYKQKISIYKRLEIPSRYQLMGNLSPKRIIN